MREMIDLEANELQRGSHDGLRNAAAGHQQRFGNASEVVDRSLSLVFRHTKHDKSARPGISTAHLATWDRRPSRTKAASDSEEAPKGETP